MTAKERINILLAGLVILFAFLAAGSGDYADELDRENARLRAALARYQLAAELASPPQSPPLAGGKEIVKEQP